MISCCCRKCFEISNKYQEIFLSSIDLSFILRHFFTFYWISNVWISFEYWFVVEIRMTNDKQSEHWTLFYDETTITKGCRFNNMSMCAGLCECWCWCSLLLCLVFIIGRECPEIYILFDSMDIFETWFNPIRFRYSLSRGHFLFEKSAKLQNIYRKFAYSQTIY